MGLEGNQFYSNDYRLKMCIYLMHKLNNNNKNNNKKKQTKNKKKQQIFGYNQGWLSEKQCLIYDINCGPYNHNMTIQVRIR